MRLDYLTKDDKNEYIDLMYNLGDFEYNDELWRNFFQVYEESDVRAIYLARILNKKQNKEIVVGTITTIVEPKIYLPGPVVHIEDVIIAEKYRRLGLGKQMVKEVEKIADTYNASIITVSCGNDELLDFFMKSLIGEDTFVSSNAFGFTLSKWTKE